MLVGHTLSADWLVELPVRGLPAAPVPVPWTMGMRTRIWVFPLPERCPWQRPLTRNADPVRPILWQADDQVRIVVAGSGPTAIH
jgi:hypothetical protein